MLWLKTSGRSARTVASASSSTPRKSGVSTSTEASGSFALEGADRGRVVAGAAVGDVVAVDRGDDDVLQAHLRGRLREAERLERVGRRARLARVDVAVAARARAGVAEDLERRRAAAPALGDVRAARLLADRVQALAVEQLAHLEVARVRARRAHLHPLRAAGPLSDRQRLVQRQLPLPIGDAVAIGFAAIFSWTGWGQSPVPSSAGSSSKARARRPPRARRRGSGRTSSTVDRPAELARDRREGGVLEPAGRDPVGERRRVEVDVQRVAVRRHPARRRGRRSTRSCAAAARARRRSGPRSASPRARTRPSVRMTASSRSRHVALHVAPVAVEVEDRVADELAGPVVGGLAAAVGLDDLDLGVLGDVELAPSSVRRPSVITGGCSRRTTVSGIAPCETAAASARCSSHASPYGVAPRLSRYAPRFTAFDCRVGSSG